MSDHDGSSPLSSRAGSVAASVGAASSNGKSASESDLDRLLRDVAMPPLRVRGPPLAFCGTSRYHVLRRLGAGGFGVVYLVRDVAAGADVALKTLPVAHPDFLYRLKREFRALCDLRHPNLVSLYELVADEESCFFTMEYVPGCTFIEHVRRGGGVDEGRLRASLAQLVRGISALHEHGKLHRDIKPSNVLVSNDERVVILDFGLTTEIEENSVGRSTVNAGTPAYMSPEHDLGEPISTASDWYSMGAMLYEALTGRVPARRRSSPTGGRIELDLHLDALSSEGVSRDLVELCCALLRHDPEKRPSSSEIAAVVHPRRATDAAPAATRAAGSPFLGRELELGALRDALAEVRAGTGLTVHIEGASGSGKTALVQQFLGDVAHASNQGVVLRGRCYERERVPYPGIDSLVDDLCRFLERRGQHATEAVLPRHVSALVRLFPVLGRVPAIAEQCRIARVADPDQQTLRQRAFGALRELFGRMSDRQPLVLFIDDLQWGDLDTAALVDELVRPPDAPAMLLVLAYRQEDRDRSRCVQALLGRAAGEVRRIEVGPLESAAAEALARTVLGADDAADTAARVASESGGNPFFLLELARFAAVHRTSDGATGDIGLAAALRARIERLPAPARTLLELVAIAGHPIRETVARAAAEISGPPWESWGALVGGYFVRFTGSVDERDVEPIHDRIRETVASSLAPERVIECHGRLARALEAAGNADPEVLARHCAAAGDLLRAYEGAVRAAAQAERALAFDRAARLFRWAIQLAPEGQDRGPLLASLAEALAHAGRGVEAAATYLDAAELAAASRRISLRREAALQLLQSGHIDRGTEVATETLRAAGLSIPRTPRNALLSLLLHTARIRLRGLGFRARRESEIPAAQLERMDHLWALCRGLSMVDEIRGSDFAARHLWLALTSGEPRRVGLGLAVLAGHSAVAAPHSRRTLELIRTVERDAMARADLLVDAYVHLAKSVHAWSTAAWPATLELADEAAQRFAECTGAVWEVWTSRAFSLASLFYQGRFGELTRRVDGHVAEASDRGNVYAMTAMRVPFGIGAWLARGDLSGARRQLDDVAKGWSVKGFHIQHGWLLLAEGYVHLCAGDATTAWARMSERWPELRRSLILRMSFFRTQLTQMRGACAVAAAAQEHSGRLRRELLREAARSSAQLERDSTRMARSLAKLLRAAIAAQEKRHGDAAALLATAATELSDQHLHPYAAAARAQLAELTGTAKPPFLPGEDVADRDAFVRMLAPGFATS